MIKETSTSSVKPSLETCSWHCPLISIDQSCSSSLRHNFMFISRMEDPHICRLIISNWTADFDPVGGTVHLFRLAVVYRNQVSSKGVSIDEGVGATVEATAVTVRETDWHLRVSKELTYRFTLGMLFGECEKVVIGICTQWPFSHIHKSEESRGDSSTFSRQRRRLAIPWATHLYRFRGEARHEVKTSVRGREHSPTTDASCTWCHVTNIL
jgi:hypothetical protein